MCGSAIDDMRAVQVPEKASFLNSNDVFVLETPSKTFIWYGSASSQEEKDLGIEVSNMVSPDHATETIAEGEEPEEFWNALGGKEPYTTEPPEVAPALKTRLFHCTLSSLGRLRVEEIKSFKQEVFLSLIRLWNYALISFPLKGLGRRRHYGTWQRYWNLCLGWKVGHWCWTRSWMAYGTGNEKPLQVVNNG